MIYILWALMVVRLQVMILQIGNSDKGITLFEIMITVSIIAVGLVLVIQANSINLKFMKLSQEYLQATLLAEQILWDFESRFIKSGDFIENKNFNCILKIDDTDQPGISQLKLDILWGNKQNLRGLEVITYLKE